MPGCYCPRLLAYDRLGVRRRLWRQGEWDIDHMRPVCEWKLGFICIHVATYSHRSQLSIASHIRSG